MSIMRLRVSSFLFPVCVVAAVFVQPRRGFALQEQAPQTQDQIQARNALNQGVQAFRNGQSDEAIRQFIHAKELDPKLLNARLYLATAYASLYIPGAPSEENLRRGHQAIEEFKGVLQIDAQNLNAMDGIGSLLFQMAGQPFSPDGFLESKTYHLKHIVLRPEDPEPYYWVGVIDWTLAFRASQQLRAEFNQHENGEALGEADPLPVYLQVRYETEFGPTISEGIDHLKRAIALRPDYDDAMAYLNLLYRRKADVAKTDRDREDLIQMAEDLVEKVKEIKEKRMRGREQ